MGWDSLEIQMSIRQSEIQPFEIRDKEFAAGILSNIRKWLTLTIS